MIEINLIPEQEGFKLPVIAGFDLNRLNFKFLVLFYLLNMGTESLLHDHLEGIRGETEKEAQLLRAEHKNLRKKTRQNKDLTKQIEEFIKQEKRLKDKFGIVKTIIESKQNPLNIFMYISKNIPEDLWVTDFAITDKKLMIKGQSLTYKSIGKFIENLRTSIYFDANFNFGGSETKQDSTTGRRTEYFEVEGTIVRFN